MDELTRFETWPILIFAVLLGIAGQTKSDAAGFTPLPHYSAPGTMREDSTLRAVDFASPSHGLAVGDRGTILRTQDGGQSWQIAASPVDCRLDDVVWVTPSQAIAVGGAYDPITRISRGVVLRTRDGGGSWQAVPGLDLPRLRHIEKQEDRSLLVSGDWSHSSLSSQFESHDGGRNWQGVSRGRASEHRLAPELDSSDDLARWNALTRSPAPVRDACRVDASTMCAVGDHGTILISQDDGKEWQPVRGAGRRSAVLFVSEHADQVPWSLVGSEALQWQNRVAVLLADKSWQAAPPDDEIAPSDLVGQAAMALGASGVDFMSPETSKSLEIEATRWISVHRPSVVVLDESLSPELADAFFSAATKAGVYRVLRSSVGDRGSAVLHHSAILTDVGVMASDLTSDAFHLLDPMNRQCRFDGTSSVVLSRVYESGSASIGGGGQTIAHGLPRSQVSRLSSPPRTASRHRLQTLQARLRQTRQLVDRMESKRNDEKFGEVIDMLLKQTAKEDQLRMAWSVYLHAEANRRTQSSGTPTTAIKTLANRFPGTSVSKWAKTRLAVDSRSEEIAKLDARFSSTERGAENTAAASSRVVVSPFQSLAEASPAIRQAAAVVPLKVSRSPVTQAQELQATPASEDDSAVDLQFEFHPSVLLSSTRDADGPSPAPVRLGANDRHDPKSAERQRIIQNGTRRWSALLRGSAERSIVAARSVDRPQLDGVLADLCWNETRTHAVVNDVTLMSTFDRDYVYLAAVCDASSLAPDGQPQTARARDQPLSSVDRMIIRIDTDQDLWTSHELQFSDAGRTRDSIQGDTAWDPTWYVASKRDSETLTFEIAIRRQDLQVDPIRRDQTWFVSAEVVQADADSTSPILPCADDWLQVMFD